MTACADCNGTGYKGGVDPLDFRDHPDAGRLVFEKCYKCRGTGKGGEFAYVKLPAGITIERRGGTWRPPEGVTIGTTAMQARSGLKWHQEQADLIREALEQWGVELDPKKAARRAAEREDDAERSLRGEAMSEVHLDGLHVIEWREGKWQPRGSLSRKEALRLTKKALEYCEARAARLRMVLDEWDREGDELYGGVR